MAPGANILLVEVNSSSFSDLETGEDVARNKAGVSVVSNSWSSDEFGGEQSFDTHFTTPAGHIPITFLASTGDGGAYATSSTTVKTPSFPAISANVVGVGGTNLKIDSSGDYVSESGWGNGTNSFRQSPGLGGGGGGISAFVAQPSYQQGVVPASISTSNRTIPDVAIDADPNSGVPVYDTYDFGTSGPWETFGGTSLASPLFAGIVAVADQVRVATGQSTLNGKTQTLPDIYSFSPTDFHDITTGNNGYAAGVGYDLVTGLGSPIVPLVVDNLVGTVSIGTFTATPSNVSLGNSTTLAASSVLSTTGTITGVKFYLESNSAAGLQIGSDTLLGTGVLSGGSWVLPASTTGLALGNYTLYAVATDSAGFTSPPLTTQITVSAAAVTIGSFTANPATDFVGTGTTTTLTAANVTTTASGATVTSVKFYAESNSTAGLQTAGDTLLGTGTQNGTTWTFSTSVAGFAAGNYVYYALAADSSNTTATASTNYSVVIPTPAIGTFVVSAAPVVTGATVTLTASNVIENGGSVAAVAFYRESNVKPGFESTDMFLGDGTKNGTTYTLNSSTFGFAAGSYTYYAVAIDPVNVTSPTSTAPLTVTADTSGIQRLRIATYNMSADSGSTTALPGFTEALEGIGQESVGGFARPVDLLALQETTSNALSVAPVVAALNTYYGGVAVYAAASYQATQFGDPSAGNGPNAVIYDTNTLNLIATVPLSPPAGASNGEFRQVVRYEFQPSAAIGNTGIFYAYDVHSDAGSSAAALAARNLEAGLIRADEATLPADARVLYLGDFETSGPTDASFQTLTAATAPTGAAQGAAVDPLGVTGSWSTNAGGLLTNSPTALVSRTDLVLGTSNVFTSGGLDYIAGSYHTFGNDGSVTAGGSVLGVSNAALSTDLVQNGGPLLGSQTVLGDLSTASAHLPVVADFNVPLTSVGTPGIGSFTVTPTSVVSGGAITLTATGVVETGGVVKSVNFYLDTDGTPGLQPTDTLVGSGTQSGTTWTLATNTAGLAAGTYTYYAVAADSGTGVSAPLSSTIVVTAASNGPTIDSLTFDRDAVPIGTTVVLTASNVVDPNMVQISDVTFYRETNGIPGLQIGSDTLIGTGDTPDNGNTWTISVLTNGLLGGAYTYYAFATNVLNVSSVALQAPLTVTAGHPAIPVATWNMLGQGAFGTQGLPASTFAAGVTNSLGLTRGDGVSTANSQTAKANAWGGANWADTSEDGLDNDQYLTFGLTVAAGETLSLADIDLNYRRTAGFGPENGYWQYQINGGDWNLIGDFNDQFSSNNSAGAAITPVDLTTIPDLQYMAPGTSLLIRLVPYGGTGTTSTWYVYHKAAPDLAILGSIVPTSTVTITDAGPAPSQVGQQANFNVQVSGVSGHTPTGVVAIEDADNNDAIVGTGTLSLSSASATISTSILSDGIHHLIAVYTGDLNNAISQSAPLAHDVVYGTTTTLVSSAPSSAFGQMVTLTATIGAPAAGATGAVQFLDGTNVLGIVDIDSNGVATLNVSNLAAATHSITAIYSGDLNFAGSSSTATTVTVSTANTSTSAQSSEPTANIGDNVTFTAQVVAILPGLGIPTGNVQFTVDGVNQGSPVPLDVSGKASLSVSTLAVGPHQVAAIYKGDSNFVTSTSTSISQTVVAGPIQVNSVVVNGDHLNPAASQQRSEVSSILYTFNQPVMLTSNSVTIVVTAGQTGTLPTLAVAPVAGSGNTKWLVTFTGAGVNGATRSIADGVYDITLVGANVLAGAVPMANNRVDTFFRLMGDLNGDANVNGTDFGQFSGAFLTTSGSPGFLAAADLDGDGFIGTSDFTDFVSNFLNGFSGFTATI